MIVLEIVASSDPAMVRAPVDLCGQCTAALRAWLREPGTIQANAPIEANQK
jgi:hypothetical protein